MSEAVIEAGIPSSAARSLSEIQKANGGVYPGFSFLRHFFSSVILLNHSRIVVRGERAVDLVSATSSKLELSTFFHTLMSSELFRPFLFGLVGGFFALSGFLVTGSAVRTNKVKVFLGFRALRIVPALLFEVTLSALILGPLVTNLSLYEYFSDLGVYRYFGNVIGWITFWLPGAFANNPIQGMVNANLWTLRPEFYCYLIMAVLMGSGLLGKRKIVLATVTIATLLSIIMSIFPPAGYLTRADNTHFANWFIVYLFFVGVVFAQYSDRIVVSFPLFLASGLMYVLGMTLRIPDAISCVFLVYCVVCIGAVKMSWFDSIVTKDYSYGIYLYGYPIAQAIVFALIQLGIFHQNMITTAFVMASALTITICCAAFSWAYVEKPFLRLKRHIL